MQNRLDKDPWGPQSEGSWPWKSELHTSMVQNQGGRFGSPKTHGFFGEFQETSSIPNALHKGLMDYTNIYIYIYMYVYCILYIVYCILYIVCTYIYIYTLCMGIVQSRAAVFHMEIIEVAIVSQAPLMFVFCGELDGSRWNLTRLSR